MLDLALTDQVFHGAGDLLDGHLRIDAVLVEQVDAVRAQTLERRVGHLPDALRPAVQALAGVALAKAELGRDHDLVAHRLQRLPDHAFVDEGAVGFRRVEKRDSALEGGADQLDGVGRVGVRPVAVAQAHAAQAQFRYDGAIAAQLTSFHMAFLC